MRVEDIRLRKIIDSRTNPTVEVEVNGFSGKAPSGASKGVHEVSCHVPENLEELEDILSELEDSDLSQEEFDSKLKDIDGTEDFSRLGAVSVAASFAFKKADGFNLSNQFPLPLSNVVGGGEHGGNTSIQEFLVLPLEAETFPEAVRINTEIYQELKERYSRKVKGINDEGALVTSMDDHKTLDAVSKVAEDYGAAVGLDIAASEFFEDGRYRIGSMDMDLSPEEMVDFVGKIIEEYDLIYVEDPLDQNDFRNHSVLRSKYPDTMICGDDLFTTSEARLRKGIENGSGNSLIVKPNQVGTVTDTRETVETARENSYTPVISHRSGETCDATISDLALEWKIPFIKAGIADIRIAKLNRLIKLWDDEEDPSVTNQI